MLIKFKQIFFDHILSCSKQRPCKNTAVWLSIGKLIMINGAMTSMRKHLIVNGVICVHLSDTAAAADMSLMESTGRAGVRYVLNTTHSFHFSAALLC